MRDWEEDYKNGENQYSNRCTNCGSPFFGHKYRATCKECFDQWKVKRKKVSPWQLIGVISKLPIDAEIIRFGNDELFITHNGQDYVIKPITSENPVWVETVNGFTKDELSAISKMFDQQIQETTPRKKRGFQDRLDAAIKEQERVQKLKKGDQIDTQ